MVALAIAQGDAWGWASAAVLASVIGSGAFAAAFVVRTRGRPNPAVDLTFFDDRRFGVANLGTLVCAMAFYGMLFGNVLFLTPVWGYTALEAGLALTPAPLLAAAVAGLAGRVADARGHRLVIAPGGVVYACSGVLLATRADAAPDYLTTFLPATLLIGVGLGMAFPTLSAAAVSNLSAARFATGSAINAAARQVGAVLGIAVVAAIVDAGAGGADVSPFQAVWALSSALALAVAALVLAMLGQSARTAALAGEHVPPTA